MEPPLHSAAKSEKISNRQFNPITSVSARAVVDSHGAIAVSHSNDVEMDSRRFLEAASRATVDSYGATAALRRQKISTRPLNPHTSMGTRATVVSYVEPPTGHKVNTSFT